VAAMQTDTVCDVVWMF